jgi:hypothetical protein
VQTGSSVTLSWDTSYADWVSLDGVGSVSDWGSKSIPVYEDSTFFLRVSNSRGSDVRTVTVYVY